MRLAREVVEGGLVGAGCGAQPGGAGGLGSVSWARPARSRWSWAWVNSMAWWSPVSVTW